MIDTSDVGANIRAVRRQRGLTQEELAKMAGLSTMSIRRYEKGERIITDEIIVKIATALDIEWQKLKGWVLYGFEGDYNGEGVEKWGPPDEAPEYYRNSEADIDAIEVYGTRTLKRINTALKKLNQDGQQKAVERVEELTEIPRYQKEPSQPPQDPSPQDNETMPENGESPPEGRTEPKEAPKQGGV